MSTGTTTKRARRVQVARIPPGVAIDDALSAMNGMSAIYPKNTLSLCNDESTGGMLIIHDPDAAPPAESGPAPAVTVALGDDEPGDLLAYAMTVAGEDAEAGLKMLTLGLATMLEQAGAANYLTFGVGIPDVGSYAVTIQRAGGRTPAERITELEQRIAELSKGNMCRHCGDETEWGDDPTPDLCVMCAKAGRTSATPPGATQ